MAKKNSVSLVLRSGATPQSSILCIRSCVGSFFFILFRIHYSKDIAYPIIPHIGSTRREV